MQGIYSVLLLIVSNIFMTFAWYGHLKLQEMKLISNWPLFGVILLSWGIALFEYCFQVPANRIGFQENGGPFTCTAQSHTRSYHTYSIRRFFGGRIPKRDPSLESSRRSGLLGSSSLFRIHEIKILTQYLRF